MSSEDQDLLARINQLAGKISQAKNEHPQSRFAPPTRASTFGGNHISGQTSTSTVDQVQGYPHSGTTWRGRGGYSSRGYRGGMAPQIHRNRTLVLNANQPNSTVVSQTEKENTNPSAGGSTWVSKTDRHRQLINTSVYEQKTQSRTKAIEQTRQQRLKQKDEREKLRFNKHLHRTSGNGYQASSSRSDQIPGNYEINVQGIRFRVAKNGSKLVKVPGEISTRPPGSRVGFDEVVMGLQRPGDGNAAKSTPKTAVVGTVRFHRSKSGNMYRDGVVKAHRRTGVITKINEPCKIFSTTGSCSKGPRCRYIHDPSKVAVCKEFLQKGACPSGDSCDLSHELTPERTPTCLHFTKGNCSNPNCRYIHVRVSPSALACRPFGIYGFCEKGDDCTERHINECPDFSNTGTCTTKGCKLLHREKASVMRSNAARHSTDSPEGQSDISSDEDEEEIDSDDVDSDDLEEFFGEDDGPADTDIPMQQDFVQLS